MVQAKFADETTDFAERLHAAYALAEFGGAPQEFLLDAIPIAASGECPNLAAALQGVKSACCPN